MVLSVRPSVHPSVQLSVCSCVFWHEMLFLAVWIGLRCVDESTNPMPHTAAVVKDLLSTMRGSGFRDVVRLWCDAGPPDAHLTTRSHGRPHLSSSRYVRQRGRTRDISDVSRLLQSMHFCCCVGPCKYMLAERMYRADDISSCSRKTDDSNLPHNPPPCRQRNSAEREEHESDLKSLC